MTKYDLICIGGGSGGIAAAKRAAEYNAKVLVIETGDLGGTCVNVGCVPKKISFHAAQFADYFRLAKDYGFSGLEPKLDWKYFVNKRDLFINKLNNIYEKGLTNNNIDIEKGFAKFVDNNVLEVNGKKFTSENIIIAVGGKPTFPKIDGAELGITSDDFFALKELPKSITIVGSGYIAVEIAGVLNSLGVLVNLIVRNDYILKQSDSEITKLLSEIMLGHNINIIYESSIKSLTKSDGKIDCRIVSKTGKDYILETQTVLWAIGRLPLTTQIGLENTSIEMLANNNIKIDKQQNTTQKGIYAIGDITGQPTLTPAAIEAGRQLSERLFNNKTNAKADFSFVPTVIFSHPAIASVGLTEQEASQQFGENNIKVYSSKFNPLLRSMTEHKVPTLMKLICEEDNEKIIGIHLIGDYVDEIIQGFAVAVQMGATKKDFDQTLAIHPTSGEELVTLR